MKDNLLQMYYYYANITVKSWFQYKVDACMRSLAVLLREATNVIVIYLTLLKFNTIDGWNLYELLLLFSFVYVTYGILIIFFTGLRDFEKIVNNGQFDRFLLRPRGVLFQVISSNSDWFAAIGHGGLGILLFLISANKANIQWTISKIIYCVLAMIGGVLIQGAIFLFIASLSFYLIKTGNIRNLLYSNTRKFANYPISIFPNVIKFLMIYIIPFAFVNYFPASLLLGKNAAGTYHMVYYFITPLLGSIMYMIAYLFWRFSLRHYKSSGN